MKIFFGLLFGCMSLISFGQENPAFAIEWDTLNTQLSENYNTYTIEHREIIPSLSFINPTIATGNYYLMEINLAVDLRTQHLKDEAPILLLPKNKFIQSDYSVALPTTTGKRDDFKVTITGNGGYNSNSPNNGGVKNNAYRDASTYTGIYCPVTGLPLTPRGRNN